MEIWNWRLYSSSPFVQDGIVYCGSDNNHLYAVDAKTGKEQLKFETGSDIYGSDPTVFDGIVYIGCRDNNLYAVDAKTGREQWKFETEGSLSSPTIVNEIVYFSSYKTLYALDIQDINLG